MSSKEKRLNRILNNPKEVRFKELDALLLELGYIKRQSGGGGSHFVYSHENSHILVVLAVHGANPILPTYQVKKAINSINSIVEDKNEIS